jgi:hypothetical protein
MTPGASMAERGRTQIVRGSLSACPTDVIDASRSPNSRLSQKKECLGYVSPQNRHPVRNRGSIGFFFVHPRPTISEIARIT